MLVMGLTIVGYQLRTWPFWLPSCFIYVLLTKEKKKKRYFHQSQNSKSPAAVDLIELNERQMEFRIAIQDSNAKNTLKNG